MIPENDLIRTTDSFFECYWNPSNGKPPIWSEHWNFEGEIPNQTTRGCYALFKNNEIIYIGAGIGKSADNYHGAGLGDRLKRYWKVNKSGTGSQYAAREGWGEVTSIITIGFEEKHYPLAAALEVYLIRALDPEMNILHKKRS